MHFLHIRSLCSCLYVFLGSLDILEDEEAFRAQVEEDAVSFKPIGTLIHSYTRHSGTGKGKGKETALVEPDSDEALVFEAYHVCDKTPLCRLVLLT